MQPMTGHESSDPDDKVRAGHGAGEAAPPAGLLESAMRSVANGMPVNAVARWLDVSESELRGWIDETADRVPPAPDPTPASDPTPAPEPVRPPAPKPVDDHHPTEPAVATPPSQSAARRPAVYSSTRAVVPERRSSHPSPMSVRDSLQVLRRRLLIVVLLVILGGAAGWISAPGKTAGQVSYRATHTLIYEPHGSQAFNIQQVSLLGTSGEVPSRVAARLKLDRAHVRSAVTAAANAEVATISITGRSA